MKLGFIGLGIMGRPMAGHLIAAGHQVHLMSRSGVPRELTDAGGLTCATPAEVARHAEVIFTMVPDTPDMEKVLFGENGVERGLTGGKLVADMSTISPVATREFARRVAAHNCEYLDAPVSGGEVGAKNATLTIMVGGPASAFDRVRPLFETMGKSITHIGPNGTGQVTKLANNIVVALNIEAVAEALVFAAKAGADPARVRQALLGGFAGSRILELHGERMIRRSFEPGFRIGLHQKDLAIALSVARELGVSLPNTATAQELFNACVARGGLRWDHSAMIRALEALAAFELPPAESGTTGPPPGQA
jgi:2-hydroxy-3-oxopropionate reductase